MRPSGAEGHCYQASDREAVSHLALGPRPWALTHQGTHPADGVRFSIWKLPLPNPSIW